MMKCDLCDKAAVVHEVTIRNGVKKEIHLCAEHAKASGIAVPGYPPVDEVLTQFAVSKAGKKKQRQRKALTCDSCGLTFAEFRKRGVLGCPECYDAFESQLGPMIERAQNGGASHAGKCPKRGGASIDRQLQIKQLLREMEEAVAAEQYERAAVLRDRLRELESTLEGNPGGAAVKERPAR